MITIHSFLSLWEEALQKGEIEKAKDIRHEITKIMKYFEKEKSYELLSQ